MEIKKVLIANRGEIVRRIITTCQKMGIETVAVYSDADRDAHYLADATETYYIGKSAPVKSYLNMDVLIQAVKDTGADAVHPGYGFLSESAEFAEAVARAGAKWIGPDPEILKNIESKCYCRNVASSIGVPVTPGTIRPINSINEIYETAGKVGLPILLKLDKGGGGKGIQKIETFESEEVVQAQLESMQRIGEMAFASSDVYVEKAVQNPRHIEVQFMADEHGHVVCLGERECSIQRRYQKIIEESPSAVVTSEDRKKLYGYTSKLIREMKYSGAGTVEYLRAQDGSYYFMEINARLQVEHPVTEAVTGLDLVKLQIQTARGEKLPISQEDVRLNGHAMECRIYAEDPKTFNPAPGVIDELKFPDTSDGDVRVDHALYEGYRVSPFYDPMLCKLIVRADDRQKCIDRMLSALKEFVIGGVTNTIVTEIAIMRDRSFVAGNFTTAFLEREKLNIGLENYVITISRQFGSLGRPIARKMAELLGIEYYDRDIVEQAVRNSGMEIKPDEVMDSIEGGSYEKMKYPLGTLPEEEQDRIFKAQSDVILELARKESCIIVGRCSDYVLRNARNHFSIYIYAPYEVRLQNCIAELHIEPEAAKELITSVDEARRSYAMHYAKEYSEDFTNKDILIDSSLYGSVDEAAHVLTKMIKKKFNLS